MKVFIIALSSAYNFYSVLSVLDNFCVVDAVVVVIVVVAFVVIVVVVVVVVRDLRRNRVIKFVM